jgi:hypothetical protein
MAKKMYYTEQEAADMLGCSVEELDSFVSDQKIRVFKDGLQNVYTAKEVDALAAELGLGGDAGDTAEISLEPAEEISLEPAEDEIFLAPSEATAELEPISLGDDTAEEISLEPASADSSVISLSEVTDTPTDVAAPSKEDTVLSSDGVSIFDQSDFEVEGVDPMAKTHMASSMEDQISMDSVGGGSGLLDLTRESDETSLGAEILEHIDADSDETPPMDDLLGGDLGELTTSGAPAMAPISVPEPVVVEELDPKAGLFGGLAVGCGIMVLFIAAVSLASLGGLMPGYLTWLGENMIVLVIAPIVILAMSAGIGFMVGKSMADRQAAIRRAGG